MLWLVDVSGEEHVLVDAPALEAGPRARLGQPPPPGRAGAGDRRSHEEEHLVHEARFEERRGERRPAFEEERLDALAPELRERLRERPADELQVTPPRQRSHTEGEPPGLARRVDAASVETRRVGANRSHPDRDCPRRWAPLVDAAPGSLPCYPAPSGNGHAPVEGDGRLVGDEGPP